MPATVRLTMKRAKELVRQEFGVSANSLTAEAAGGCMYIYKMNIGRIQITVENDWNRCDGLISLRVHAGGSEASQLFFHPDTLQEDFGAEEAYRRECLNELHEEFTLTQM